jgi:hypothetical protein
MHKIRIWAALGCCLFAVSLLAWAQAKLKPGLYEMTTTMTWQQSPMPAGMNMPAGHSPFGGAPITTQVCITQAIIDKYGAPVPQSHGDCKVTNVAIKADGMSAEIACTGMMNAKGHVESSWTDANTVKSKMHMAGSMQMGPNAMPVEWTTESTSIYKGADCGSVKPLPLPKN